MSKEKGFQYSISFTQSVSSGIIAFHGSYQFDNILDTDFLVEMLEKQEKAFERKGYKVASRIEPKQKEVIKKDEKE